MKTYILSLALVMMLIPAASAQGQSSRHDYGWSDAETAYARMQEAFLCCVTNYILKLDTTNISSMQSGDETTTNREGKGHFSAHITEYEDNGKVTEIKMAFYPGEQYRYEFVERSYSNEQKHQNKSDLIMRLLGDDGIEINFSFSTTDKDNKSHRKIEILGSTKFSR